MGRILTRVRVANYSEPDKALDLTALVDTGASHLTLPLNWKDKLGDLPVIREVNCEIANQTVVNVPICGPVELQIEGFPRIIGEVMFWDMQPSNGHFEPLLGYLPLEASQAAVDVLGQRLVFVKNVDLK